MTPDRHVISEELASEALQAAPGCKVTLTPTPSTKLLSRSVQRKLGLTNERGETDQITIGQELASRVRQVLTECEAITAADLKFLEGPLAEVQANMRTNPWPDNDAPAVSYGKIPSFKFMKESSSERLRENKIGAVILRI